MSEEKDRETRIALFVVFALVTLVVLGVVWFGAVQGLGGKKAVPTATVAATSSAATSPSEQSPFATGPAPAVPATQSSEAATATGGSPADSRVAVENGIARFFFPAASASLPEGAAAALADLVARLGGNPDARIAISGFTETAGDATATELARQRAFSVRDLLLSLGVPADRLQLRDPVSHPGAANGILARHVEVEFVTNATTATADGSAADADGPRIIVEDGVVKFYFAVGKNELAPGAADALLDVAAAVHSGRKAVISGFTDASGSAELNEELAKQRAFAVRDALLGLNIPESSLELRKPETLTGTGHAAEARRVEVRLAD